MSTTIADVVLEDTPSSSPIAASTPIAAPRRAAWSWVAVIAVGVAAVVPGAAALGSHSPSVHIDSGRTIAEHGSVSAIDHRDVLVLRARHTPDETVAEHGSVGAIDHRDALAGRR